MSASRPHQISTLDLRQLEGVREFGDKIIARCPICAEEGHDRRGDHLSIVGDYATCIRDPGHSFEVEKMIEGAWKPDRQRPVPRPGSLRSRPKPRTQEQIRTAHGYCLRLARNESAVERIARHRGWKPQTVRGLALDADLGWTGREIALCYGHGCKLRWWRKEDRRGSRWMFGGDDELWRGAWITVRDPSRVWICESEMDAVTMIDQGFDDMAKGDLVVALPGATTWRREWAPMFRGRQVVIVPDADKDGAKAAQQIGEYLVNFAAGISVYQWQVRD